MNKSLHNVYLSLGSNLGNKKKNLESALEYINKQIGKVISVSSFYETAPIGFESANTFLNAACHIQTKFTPDELLKETQNIEKKLGRTKKSVNGDYSDRIIDIDILLYDDLIINEPDLLIPHPRMHERAFVMIPLSEIAEEIIHPVLKQRMLQIKNNLD